jgi:hypothetical protein
VSGKSRLLPKSLIYQSEPDLFRVLVNSIRESGKSKKCTWSNRRSRVVFPFFFLFFFFCSGTTVRDVRTCVARGVSWSLVGRTGKRTERTEWTAGRCRALGHGWLFGADTQSGQINFTARRNNVIGGVRLEMSA